MKRISKKRLAEFIEKVAYVEEWEDGCGNKMDAYWSKIDGAYFTFIGLEDDLKFLLKKGITEQLQNKSNKKGCTVNIGFNPKEQKWYGWSHRAIFGFGIGSTCKKGDCHYSFMKGEWTAKTLEDAKQMAKDFAEGVS